MSEKAGSPEAEPEFSGEGLGALATRIIDSDQKLIETAHAAEDAAERSSPSASTSGSGGSRKSIRSLDSVPLRKILAAGGVAPVLALSLLNMVDLFERAAFGVFGPNIQRSFGLSDSALVAMAGIGGLIAVGSSVPIAVLADRHPRRRTLIAFLAAAVFAIFSFASGLARATWQLVGARILSGIGQSSVEPVHGSLLSDYYPVEARTRIFSIHTWGAVIGTTAGPVTAGAIARVIGGPEAWRWVVVVTACMTVPPALWVLRLKSPASGRAERERVLGASAVQDQQEQEIAQPKIAFSSAVQRLLRIRTIYSLLAALGVYGFTVVSAPVLLGLWFEGFWHLDELQRGVIATVIAAVGLVGIPLGGIIGDRVAQREPGWSLVLLGVGVVAHMVIFTTALYMPSITLVVALIALSNLPILIVVVPARAVLSKVAPPELRSLAFALVPLAILFLGGFLGGAIFGAIADATDERLALTLLLPFGLIGGAMLVRGARFAEGDIALVEEEIREEDAERERLRSGGHPQLLQVRNLDFSYGQVQVLFDVNLDISEGEIVALLGTNGAGKSTLLRLVCGLDHPERGLIRFDGANITFLETEKIVRLGIDQVPGGRALFPGLTVRENLQVATRKNGAARQGGASQGWDEALSHFPSLVPRMGQLAGTLSGGEQQMLALAKSFLNRPRLLMVDELSLGLAPAVVSMLMNVIREMNKAGTTILLVEQSVNVALSIADRAIFMEKGEVRFEGPAADLLERRDLLRSVFLGGAVVGSDHRP